MGSIVVDGRLVHPRSLSPPVSTTRCMRPGRCNLPGGTGLPGQAALLDDTEQPVGIGRTDAPPAKTLPGKRKQTAEYEFSRRSLAQARPVELRLDAVPGRRVQVLRSGCE